MSSNCTAFMLGVDGQKQGGSQPRGVKNRWWVFTINNPIGEPTGLLAPNMEYLAFGREGMGPGQTPHLQGVVKFKHPVARPSRYFEQFGAGHFEIMRGTPEEAIEYCKKEGDFQELRTRPQRRCDQGHHGVKGGVKGGRMEAARWEDAWSSAKQGRLEEVPADLRTRYFNTYSKVASKYQKKPSELKELNNLWIHGKSGSGKSTWAHRTFPNAFDKPFSKWWDGFQEDNPGHQVVILDDLHPKWSGKEKLKNWGDRYAFMAEYKGGSMLIRPKRIIITSNYTPDQVLSFDRTFEKNPSSLLGVLPDGPCPDLEALPGGDRGRLATSSSKAGR